MCVAKKDGLCVDAHDMFITIATRKTDLINSSIASQHKKGPRGDMLTFTQPALYQCTQLGRVMPMHSAVMTYENIRIYQDSIQIPLTLIKSFSCKKQNFVNLEKP